MFTRMNKQIGFTLIEFMISLFFTLSILSSLTFIYLNSQKEQQIQSALLTLQENNRLVMDLLNTAIHTAGYMGCARLSDNFIVRTELPIHFSKATKIKPYKGKEIKKASDSISIMRVNPITNHLIQRMNDFKKLILSVDRKIEEQEILLISDCTSAEIFKVQQVINMGLYQIIFPQKPLKKLYDLSADIGQLENNIYYIAKTDRFDNKNLPIYALYQKDIYSKKSELLEGIYDMKILYSVLEKGLIKTQTGDELNSNANIIGVSIMLAITALDQIAFQKKFFYYVALRN